MRRILVLASIGVLAALNTSHAQQKLKTDGYGSLSGTVTLDGKIPAIVDLTAEMMKNRDKDCCLDPKAGPLEKIDQTWLVDPKTKGVANVVIWVKPPTGTYLEVPEKFQNRKDDKVIIDQPHCAFLPRVSVYNPVYFDGAKFVPTGQELILRNSAAVGHNVRAIGHPKYNKGFNKTVSPRSDLNVTRESDPKIDLNPAPLPVSIQCDLHTWMKAQVFVFDHPYYATTNAKGEYSIPMVPAGAEVSVIAWHEGPGWAFKEGKVGRTMTITKDKNTKLDFTLTAP